MACLHISPHTIIDDIVAALSNLLRKISQGNESSSSGNSGNDETNYVNGD
jgi:hypothetical protein